MADLDVDRIVTAALHLVDREGAKALTMRAVADALDVTPMAIYRHVEDKAALVGHLVDAVIAERPLPAPTGDWREDLWLMASWMRAMTLAHPAVSNLRRVHQVWSPAILPITERWMSVWSQSGLPLDAALRAAVTTSMAIIGMVEEELLFRKMTRPTDDALTWVPTARLAFARTPDREGDFELVIRSMIDGVHARLSAEAEKRSTA